MSRTCATRPARIIAKALTTDGDADKAIEWLRQKGIASAEKVWAHSRRGCHWRYIHTGARVGVLIEVNCETDFMARGDMFQELLRDVAMQVAACPGVEYVTTDVRPRSASRRKPSKWVVMTLMESQSR